MDNPQERLNRLNDDLWSGKLSSEHRKAIIKADPELLETVLNNLFDLIVDEFEAAKGDP